MIGGSATAKAVLCSVPDNKRGVCLAYKHVVSFQVQDWNDVQLIGLYESCLPSAITLVWHPQNKYQGVRHMKFCEEDLLRNWQRKLKIGCTASGLTICVSTWEKLLQAAGPLQT